MTTIKEKVDKRLNDTFTENFREYLTKQFPDVKFESHVSLETLSMVTIWDTEDPQVCAEIKKIGAAYEAAYSKAREEVWSA